MPVKLTTEEFVRKARMVHGNRYDYSQTKYINAITKIKVKCKKHNIEFKQYPYSFISKKCGCKKCFSEKLIKILSKDTKWFIKHSQKIHGKKYNYSKVKYLNYYTPIKILCNRCNNFFIQMAGNHLSGCGCPECGGTQKITKKEFIKRSKAKFKNRYDYSLIKTLKNISSKISLICKKHGKLKIVAWEHLHSNNGSCVKCHIEKLKIIHVLKKEDFVKRATKIHKEKYNYSKVPKISNGKTRVKIICPIHGIFLQSKGSHLCGHGCPKCKSKTIGDKSRLNIKKLIRKAKKIHNNFYDYSCVKYYSCDKPVIIGCPDHGKFSMPMYSHINQKSICPRCSKKTSFLEKMWLDKMNIPDNNKHRQVCFKINQRSYKVDGYMPKTKTIYEFLGDYYHGNPKIYNLKDMNKTCHKTYGELYSKTIEREKMFTKLGYKIISIWENDFNKQLKLSNCNKPTTSQATPI
jgi:hypothetical protein